MTRIFRINIKAFFSHKLFAAIFLTTQIIMLLAVFFSLSEMRGVSLLGNNAADRSFSISGEEVDKAACLALFGEYDKRIEQGAMFSEVFATYHKGAPRLTTGRAPKAINEIVIPQSRTTGEAVGDPIQIDGKEFIIVGIGDLLAMEDFYFVSPDAFAEFECRTAKMVFKRRLSDKEIKNVVASIASSFDRYLDIGVPNSDYKTQASSMSVAIWFVAVFLSICAACVSLLFSYFLNLREKDYRIYEIVGADKSDLNFLLFLEILLYCAISYFGAVALYFILRAAYHNFLIDILGINDFLIVLLVYAALVGLCVAFKYLRFNKKLDLRGRRIC